MGGRSGGRPPRLYLPDVVTHVGGPELDEVTVGVGHVDGPARLVPRPQRAELVNRGVVPGRAQRRHACVEGVVRDTQCEVDVPAAPAPLEADLWSPQADAR